jgi:uncharacterized protein
MPRHPGNYSVLALFVCISIQRTGILWFAIGSHMAIDWGDSFFYSTGHKEVQGHLFHATLHGSRWFSGGDTGPDGNIFDVFLVAVGIFLLSRLYPQVKYTAEPYAARSSSGSCRELGSQAS